MVRLLLGDRRYDIDAKSQHLCMDQLGYLFPSGHVPPEVWARRRERVCQELCKPALYQY